MKPARYRIRDLFRGTEELLEEKDVLRRIRSGKFMGDEQAAAEGSDDFKALSSHPRFYDAFLKKLFAVEYESPDKSVVNAKSPARSRTVAAPDHATRQEPPDHTEQNPEPPNRSTEQLAAPGTVRQSLLDDLFSDVGTQKREVPGEKTGSALVAVSPTRDALDGADALGNPAFGASQRPDDRELLSQPLAEAPPEKRKNLRPILLAGVVALGAFYVFGTGPKETKRKPAVEDLAPLEIERASLNDALPPETKALKQQTIMGEGDTLAAQDTLLFYRGAYDSYREALQVDSKSKLVGALYGRLAVTAARLVELGEGSERLIQTARSAIAAGRRIDPQASSFYRAEALLYLAEGRGKEARQAVYNALDTDPQNSENALVLAETQLVLGEGLSARTAVDEAARVQPSLVRARVLNALLAAALKDWAKARSEALAAIQLNPLHAEAYLIVARASLESGQIAEARGLLENAARLARFTKKANAAQAYLLLGQLQQQEGKTSEAKVSYRLAYYYAPNDKEVKSRADGLNLDPDSLKRLAQDAEYGPDYFSTQGDTLYQEGRLAEALRFYQATTLLDPRDGAALVRLGEVAEKASNEYGDTVLATTIYERALARDPSLALAYVRLGSIETDQYNWARASQLLRQSVALAPNEAEPYLALAKYHYKRRDYNEAVTQLLEAMKRNPKSSEIHYYAGLVRLTVKRDSMRDAMVHFEDAYRYDPRNFLAMAEWLKLKALSGEKNFALKFVAALSQTSPKEAHLPWVLGEIYTALGEQRRAIGYYHQSLDLENRLGIVRMSLGRALEGVGELEKAVAEYSLASELDRRNGDGYFRAASIEVDLKRFADAEESLKSLTARMPNYPGAHRLLSKIHEARREKDAAILAMQKEVSINPENAKYVLELAELLIGYEKLEDAIAQLNKLANLPSRAKAPEFTQDKTRAFLLLSRCYRAQNRNESAEGSIKLALNLEPNDPELHRELGYVYYALHRDKEGVKAFQFYLDRNQTARDADTIRALIEKMRIEE